MGLDDIIARRSLDELDRPLGEARGLPGSAYGPAFFELENRYLFPRSWAAVAVGGEIPNAGDALPVELGEWPLLLVRNASGQIGAFFNICRHRGMRLVTEHSCGRTELRCPWHAWTYDLDGHLMATPDMAGPGIGGTTGELPRDCHLKPLRVAHWHDFVFVNIDGRAVPFEEYRDPVDALFADYDFSLLRFARHWERLYEGNWKIAHEGAIEDYHVRWGHPQLTVDAEARRGRWTTHDRCYAAVIFDVTYRPGEAPARALPTMLRSPGDGLDRYFVVNLFPTGQIWSSAHHAIFVLLLPDGWNRTRLVFNYYLVGEAATDSRYADERRAHFEAWERIAQQDEDYVKYVHANAQVRDRVGVHPRFAPYWEGAVRDFQRMVVETIREGEAASR